MNNEAAIEAIWAKAGDALQAIESHRQTERFRLPQLRVEGTDFYLGERQLSHAARQKVLHSLHVRESFLKLADELPASQWQTALQGLLNAQPTLELVATGPEAAVQRIAKPGRQAEANVPFRPLIEAICNGLAESPVNFSLNELNIDPVEHRLDLALLDEEQPFEIFENQPQAWRQGKAVQIDPLAVRVSPFFERLVCLNGMRVREQRNQARLSQKQFTQARLQVMLRNQMQSLTEQAGEMIQAAVSRLREHEVSVNEFFRIRNQLEDRHRMAADADKNRYERILNNYFFLEPINQAYDMDVSKTSQHWRRTATTGINAFDFFNLLTWLASHRTETELDHKDELWLQMEAADFMLRRRLDLEEVAPAKRVQYPRLAVMN